MEANKKSSVPAFISLETFEERLDFLDRSGINQVRLIGGEPTMHPQFPELIRQARLRGKPIAIFSHGLIPQRVLNCLEPLSPTDCIVLVNMNATKRKDGPDEKEQAYRYDVLERLGSRALLGYNFYRTKFQLDFLLPLISKYGCQKAIRLGLSHPTLSGDNEHLHPKQYPIVGQKIVQFARKAAEVGVRLEFDCGFVRCMFSDEGIKILIEAKSDIGWHCNPILDIDINGQVLHCFPLAAKVHTDLTDAVDASTLRDKLLVQTGSYRAVGIYRECSTCSFKENGVCMGGCLAATLRRFRQASAGLVVPVSRLSIHELNNISCRK